MRSEAGSVGELLSVCMGMLMMSILFLAYLDCLSLLNQKADVNQIMRKYILRMETTGELTAADRLELCAELEQAGASQIDLAGTSTTRVGYGGTLTLHIRGKLRGNYDFEESRVSTAKY